MFTMIRKLFKALNSSGKTWQLSLAIVLAMFVGFLPSNSLILLDLFFIALLLNINFGLFLLFSVIFSGLGYLFDPLFESIGYSVLTNESLNGFFTSLYNSALFRWSSFNYTLVTGALVISSVLSVPMYFILNVLIKTYRIQFAQKLNEWKLTKWMNLFNEEVTSTSIFRWWALSVYAGILGVFIIFFLLFFDPLARMSLEKGLSYSLQSEVNIEDFDSDLSDLKVVISGVEVSDKNMLTHNLLEVASIDFDLSFSALIDKKLMIENLQLTGVAFDTLRKSPAQAYASGNSSDKDTKEAQAVSTKEAKSDSSPFSLPNVDDILNKETLSSLVETKKLKADMASVEEKWKKVSDELEASTEVDEIKADALALQKSLKGANIQSILSAKDDISALKTKIQKVKSKYANLQKEFNADKNSLQKRISEVKNLPKKDIARLQKKYGLNATGGGNLIAGLVNDQVAGNIQKALKYYEMIKPYINDKSAQEPKEVTPPRGTGRWVHFANQSKTPELMVNNADINVLLEEDVLDVNIKDLSSDQKLSKKPMTLRADAKGKSYEHIVLNLTDDRREEKARMSFEGNAKGLKQSSIEMQTLRLNNILSDARIQGTVIDGMMKAQSHVHVIKAGIEMPSQKFVNDLLADVSTFKINVKAEGQIEKPSIKVNTDLDKQLAKGLKTMASKASEGFTKELKEGVMKKVGASTGDLNLDIGNIDSLLNSKQDSLSGINLDFKDSSSNPLKGIMSF